MDAEGGRTSAKDTVDEWVRPREHRLGHDGLPVVTVARQLVFKKVEIRPLKPVLPLLSVAFHHHPGLRRTIPSAAIILQKPMHIKERGGGIRSVAKKVTPVVFGDFMRRAGPRVELLRLLIIQRLNVLRRRPEQVRRAQHLFTPNINQ